MKVTKYQIDEANDFDKIAKIFNPAVATEFDKETIVKTIGKYKGSKIFDFEKIFNPNDPKYFNFISKIETQKEKNNFIEFKFRENYISKASPELSKGLIKDFGVELRFSVIKESKIVSWKELLMPNIFMFIHFDPSSKMYEMSPLNFVNPETKFGDRNLKKMFEICGFQKEKVIELNQEEKKDKDGSNLGKENNIKNEKDNKENEGISFFVKILIILMAFVLFFILIAMMGYYIFSMKGKIAL